MSAFVLFYNGRVAGMIKPISIYPHRLRQFGNSNDCSFVLITNTELAEHFEIKNDGSYKQYYLKTYDQGENFVALLNKLPARCHILVISPQCLIHSVKPEELSNQKKLLIFACNSAPTSLEAIEHFLRCGEQTEPLQQEEFTNQFFDNLDATQQLLLMDRETKTSAVFKHLSEDYGWHEQSGYIDWGQQQVFPSGEIACFLVPLKDEELSQTSRFSINGEITFKGYPVLHSGPPSFQLTDQERIYQKLTSINNHALIANIEDGIITSLRTTHPAGNPALDMLNNLFEIDSRFRIIYEVGFAINHNVVPYPSNSAMNEVSSSKNGTIHFGLGMLPFTQYHLDIICINTSVLNQKKEIIFGKQITKLTRQKVSQCPCLGE